MEMPSSSRTAALIHTGVTVCTKPVLHTFTVAMTVCTKPVLHTSTVV